MLTIRHSATGLMTRYTRFIDNPLFLDSELNDKGIDFTMCFLLIFFCVCSGLAYLHDKL